MSVCSGNTLFRRLLAQNQQVLTIITRGSRYEKTAVDPILNKEQLDKGLAEDDVRRFSKVKAALTDTTTLADFDPVLMKLTNLIMRKGKKALASDIVAKTYENIKRIQLEKYHRADVEERSLIELNPVTIIHTAINNAKPPLTQTRIRKGQFVYSVPVACSESRQNFKSMKWLIESAKEKDSSVRFHDKLAQEIVDTYYNNSKTIRRKHDLLRQCESNKAFAHLRW